MAEAFKQAMVKKLSMIAEKSNVNLPVKQPEVKPSS